MSWTDALTITALGMTVVFSGLILTALLISAFGLAARLQKAGAGGEQPSKKPPASSQAPVDDAVLAVISAVLEIERRLHHAEVTGRITIARSSDSRRAP